MTPIIKHLKTGNLPLDKVRARQLQMRAARYVMVSDDLCKQGFNLPLLKCDNGAGAIDHERSPRWGMWKSYRRSSLSAQSSQARIFLANIERDTIAYVKICHHCQIFAPSIKVSPEELTSVMRPWPFAKWGINIIGPLASGKVRFALLQWIISPSGQKQKH